MLPTHEDYVNKLNTAGAFENQALYWMCLEQPKHSNPGIIRSKLIAIGRTYSASIERTKGGKKKPEGPSFFDHVSECFVASKLNTLLGKSLDNKRIDDNSVFRKVIECHEHLVDLIKKSTGSWCCDGRDDDWKPAANRSFASKYLHFHKPNAFPLMDSVANKGLISEGLKGNTDDYEKFCCRFLAFSKGESKSKYKFKNWTPRSIDKELIDLGNASIAEKKKKNS